MKAQTVVVQTVAKAAGKTFLQAFIGSLVGLIPVLVLIQQDVLDGGDFNMENVNLLGLILLSGAIGGVAAVISYLTNWFKSQ